MSNGGSPGTSGSSRELAVRIASFPRWHYEFNLAGHVTPIFDPIFANRHRQRKRYFFDALLRICGGSLQGMRVLDLGCNAGFWSLAAAEAGCAFVYGVDGRAMHVEQANFVFEVNAIDRARYQFDCADIFALDSEEIGSFDVVLCLGLLHRVSRPFELLQLMSTVNDDLVVIDTDLASDARPLFELKFDHIDEFDNALTHPIVFHPSASAMDHLLGSFGYERVMLAAQFDDYTGAGDYARGERRAFIGSKKRNLLTVGLETQTYPVMDLQWSHAGSLDPDVSD
jgi:tRNA (mo5U34)-methyltransferase